MKFFTPISLHILETAPTCWMRQNWGEIDELAGLLQNPDENMEEIEKIWYDRSKFTILTNNTQNIYCDVFEKR